MPITAASKVERKYRESLEKGVEPPPPRTDVNRGILKTIREEVTLAKKEVRAAAHAGQETVRRQTKKGKAEIEETARRQTKKGKAEIEETTAHGKSRHYGPPARNRESRIWDVIPLVAPASCQLVFAKQIGMDTF